MDSFGIYEPVEPGKVAVTLPALVVRALSGLHSRYADGATFAAPGPMASVDAELAVHDPLAVVEAEYAARSMAKAVSSARTRRNQLAERLLAEVRPDGTLQATLSLDELLVLSGWANSLHVACRAQGMGGRVPVGRAQRSIGDLGDAVVGSVRLLRTGREGLRSLIAAQVACEFLEAHRELQTGPG